MPSILQGFANFEHLIRSSLTMRFVANIVGLESRLRARRMASCALWMDMSIGQISPDRSRHAKSQMSAMLTPSANSAMFSYPVRQVVGGESQKAAIARVAVLITAVASMAAVRKLGWTCRERSQVQPFKSIAERPGSSVVPAGLRADRLRSEEIGSLSRLATLSCTSGP
jgi:hypothetical protein